jgi:hypothetical protein
LVEMAQGLLVLQFRNNNTNRKNNIHNQKQGGKNKKMRRSRNQK